MTTTKIPLVVTIPTHNRADGVWCRWSYCTTRNAQGLCPDRCQQDNPPALNDLVQHSQDASALRALLATASLTALRVVADANHIDDTGGRRVLTRRIVSDRFPTDVEW